MVAHLTYVQCPPGRHDDFLQTYRDQLLSATRAQLGYRGMYLLVDRSFGRILAISLWDTGDDARAYEQSGAYRTQLDGLDECLTSRLIGRLYEVDAEA